MRESQEKFLLIKEYEKRLLEKERQMRELEDEVRDQESLSEIGFGLPKGEGPYGREGVAGDEFNVILRQQTEQSNQLREEISNKTKEAFAFRMENEDLKNTIRSLEQELRVIKMSFNSNMSIVSDNRNAEGAVLRSEVEGLKRRLESTQNKLKSSEKEVCEKNDFVKNHLMKINKEEVGKVLEVWERIMGKR